MNGYHIDTRLLSLGDQLCDYPGQSPDRLPGLLVTEQDQGSRVGHGQAHQYLDQGGQYPLVTLHRGSCKNAKKTCKTTYKS